MGNDTTDKVAATFDDWARQGRAEGMEEGHGQTAGHVVGGLPIQEGTRFLDLGCGNGWASRQAAARGAHAVGIDASKEMVERAGRLAAEAGLAPRCRFEIGDFAHLDALGLGDASIDVAWSMEALYYAPDPDAVLREVRRVLAPGGVVHILIDLYEENEASHGWSEDLGVPMALRSEQGWLDALAAAGFTDAKADRLRAALGAGIDAWKVEEGTLHLVAHA
ncbi:MAG: class I SAM-dependent methyltransferase [Thermoplasmatota archaeon]